MALRSTDDPAIFDVGEFYQVTVLTEGGSTDATFEIGIVVPPAQPNERVLTPNYDPDGGTTVAAATVEWRTVTGTVTDSDYGTLIETPANRLRVTGHGEGNVVTVLGAERPN